MLLGEDQITEDGEFVINIGPQHPSTHGVLHLKVWLDGETIKKVQPHLGYIHLFSLRAEWITFRRI